MLSAERIALLKHGAPPRNALEAALRNAWYGGGASYEKTVGPAPIISISDAKPKPAKSLIVGMEPIQAGSGDPSPDNIRPITGRTGVTVERTGVNLFDKSAAKIASTRYMYIGADSVNGEPNGSFVLADGNYTLSLSGANSTNAESLTAVDAENNRLAIAYNTKTLSFTNSVFGAVKIIIVIKSADFISWDNYDIMLNLGSSALPYEAYTGNTFPVTWQSEAGTVYGCTVDVVSGLLTVTHGMYVFSGKEAWQASSTPNRFFINLFNIYVNDKMAKQPMVANATQNVISSVVGEFVYKNADGVGYIVTTSGDETGRQLVVNTTAATTTAEINEIFTGTQLCYELTTPQTYQLTPTQIELLKGSNVLWSDADNLTLTYIGTTPANLLGGMLGNPQEPTEETSEEPTEGEDE